jgi:hypothetical protein
MIKIFRKIRHKMLFQERTAKYLLYALGEIALVMIGILLALQVNNWNTANKEKQELHDYLGKIRNNVNKDIVTLDSMKMKRLEINATAQTALANFMERREDYQVNLQTLDAFVEFYFVPNQSGYEALKNSTYLGKINGMRIDSLLDDYNAIVNSIIKEEAGYNTFIENMELRLLVNHDITPLLSLFGIDDPIKQKIVIETKEYKAILKPIFEDTIYKSFVIRVGTQTAIFGEYDRLITLGKQIMREIDDLIKT